MRNQIAHHQLGYCCNRSLHAVTANLIVALAAGATLAEAMEIAMGAASVVIHQLGTTGTAAVGQIRSLIL